MRLIDPRHRVQQTSNILTRKPPYRALGALGWAFEDRLRDCRKMQKIGMLVTFTHHCLWTNPKRPERECHWRWHFPSLREESPNVGQSARGCEVCGRKSTHVRSWWRRRRGYICSGFPAVVRWNLQWLPRGICILHSQLYAANRPTWTCWPN